VSITNPADIANALGIGQPAHFEARCQTTAGVFGSCDVQVGPGANDPNTRLVVEYASAECDLQPQTATLNFVKVQTRVDGQFAVHYLNVSDHAGGVDIPGNDKVLSIGHLVRFSHDWSGPIIFEAQYTNATGVNVFCNFTLDGQRVKP
jgi:hypothetical protein